LLSKSEAFVEEIPKGNSLPPSDAVMETENNILEDLFSSVLSQFQKSHPPPGNLKFNYSGNFQSLKLRISMEKILSISLRINFTPNTLGCYAGLLRVREVREKSGPFSLECHFLCIFIP